MHVKGMRRQERKKKLLLNMRTVMGKMATMDIQRGNSTYKLINIHEKVVAFTKGSVRFVIVKNKHANE